jgi:hypothetical protein
MTVAVNKRWLIICLAAVLASCLYGYWYWSLRPLENGRHGFLIRRMRQLIIFLLSVWRAGQEIAKFEPANVVDWLDQYCPAAQHDGG